MNRTLVIGRLVLTTGRQLPEAPWLDSCTTRHHDGAWQAYGWAIRPRPTGGRTLVVAWRGGVTAPRPPERLARWGPFAMRHGGWGHWHPNRIHWRRPPARRKVTPEGAMVAEHSVVP